MSLAVVLAAWCAAVGPIELRGGRIVDAPISEVSAAGIRVGGDQPRIIAWDHVKRITGDRAPDAERYLPAADMAWRARLRLSRGDAEMARPLFEELFATYRAVDGPTALLVAEGTLTCRLRRGEQGAACDAWLMALDLRRKGARLDGEGLREDPAHALRSLLDEATGLTPALPPIFLALDADALLDATAANAAGDPVASAFRDLYRRAASLTTSRPSEPMPTLDTEATASAGVALVRDMVLAVDPDPAVRGPARQRLLDGLSTELGSWSEAWRRAAIGASLLLEESEPDRTQGVLHLLHVPARFARSQAYLAGVCEARAAEALTEMGRGDEAAAIKASLRTREPRHPALELFRPAETDDPQPPAPPTSTGDATDAQEATR